MCSSVIQPLFRVTPSKTKSLILYGSSLYSDLWHKWKFKNCLLKMFLFLFFGGTVESQILLFRRKLHLALGCRHSLCIHLLWIKLNSCRLYSVQIFKGKKSPHRPAALGLHNHLPKYWLNIRICWVLDEGQSTRFEQGETCSSHVVTGHE